MTQGLQQIESIRRPLIGALHDFVTESGFEARMLDLVVDLVYQLSNYREEDVSLFPSVYITTNGQPQDCLQVIAPGSERIPLGRIVIGDHAGSAILKKCASLTSQDWSIFIEFVDNELAYGIFRSQQLPISVSSVDMLVDYSTPKGTALLIRNCSKHCVEIVAGQGRRLEFSLTSARPKSESAIDAFSKFAVACVHGIPGDQKKVIGSYFGRLVFDAAQRCHGTIIAVVDLTSQPLPDWLADGVVLESPIDIASVAAELQSGFSANTLATLSSREALFHGMVQSDGITVVSSDGKIVAFRVFVKPNETEATRLDELQIIGGARSRAHELLRLRIGDQLKCVLYRSQDGNTICTVSS